MQRHGLQRKLKQESTPQITVEKLQFKFEQLSFESSTRPYRYASETNSETIFDDELLNHQLIHAQTMLDNSLRQSFLDKADITDDVEDLYN